MSGYTSGKNSKKYNSKFQRGNGKMNEVLESGICRFGIW
jgi:hypothetical protein